MIKDTTSPHYVHRIYRKLFNSPLYLGKVAIPQVQTLFDEYCSMYENCGPCAYVFGFTLWSTLKVEWDDFDGEPGHLLRIIDSYPELIFIGEKGIFLYTDRSESCHRVYRAFNQGEHLCRFLEYNAEDMYWEFEYIGYYQGIINHLRFFPEESLDVNAPCPEEIWDKFSFIKRYANKSLLGPEIQLTDNAKLIIETYTGKRLLWAKGMENFHLKVHGGRGRMRLYQVTAKLLCLANADGSGPSYAMAINDAPTFNFEDSKTRYSCLWEFCDKATSYGDCFKILFEGNIELVSGVVVEVDTEFIHVFWDGRVFKIPRSETNAAVDIAQAYAAEKNVTIKFVLQTYEAEKKYKVIGFEVE